MVGFSASKRLMISSIACTRCANVYCQYSISIGWGVWAPTGATGAKVGPRVDANTVSVRILRLLARRAFPLGALSCAVTLAVDVPRALGPRQHRERTAHPRRGALAIVAGPGLRVSLGVVKIGAVVKWFSSPDTGGTRTPQWRHLMRLGVSIRLVLLAGLIAGCTAQDWREWRSHPSHFASGEHATFSLRNQGKTPKVSANDTRLAASQSWWGEPVVVRPDQIFQN